MNQINLIGNLCKDPELQKTQEGTSFARVSIAVTSNRQNDDGSYQPDYFDLKFFKNQAENIAKYARKGHKLFVTGRLQIRDYTDKDNVKRRAIEVAVNNFELLTPKGETTPKVDAPTGQNLQDIDLPDDDLPF